MATAARVCRESSLRETRRPTGSPLCSLPQLDLAPPTSSTRSLHVVFFPLAIGADARRSRGWCCSLSRTGALVELIAAVHQKPAPHRTDFRPLVDRERLGRLTVLTARTSSASASEAMR